MPEPQIEIQEAAKKIEHYYANSASHHEAIASIAKLLDEVSPLVAAMSLSVAGRKLPVDALGYVCFPAARQKLRKDADFFGSA